jgi:predicted HicB family RNase H-like nuclease
MSKNGRPLAKFNLRLPPGLKTNLEAAAMQNDRSLNAEIVHRLRASCEGYVRR